MNNSGTRIEFGVNLEVVLALPISTLPAVIPFNPGKKGSEEVDDGVQDFKISNLLSS